MPSKSRAALKIKQVGGSGIGDPAKSVCVSPSWECAAWLMNRERIRDVVNCRRLQGFI